MNTIRVLITAQAFAYVKYGLGFTAKNGMKIIWRSEVKLIDDTLFINDAFNGNENEISDKYKKLERIAEAIKELNEKFFKEKEPIIRQGSLRYIVKKINPIETIQRANSQRKLRSTFRD